MSWGDAAAAVLAFYAGTRAAKRFVDDWRERRGLSGPADDDRPRGRVQNVYHIDSRVRRIIGKIRQGRSDPEIRQLAMGVLNQKCGRRWCIPEKDQVGEVKALFGYVRENVRYVRDAWGIDQFVAARRTLQWRGGDCDDYTILLGSLLNSVGYPVALRVIRTHDSPEWNHIYLLAGLPADGPNGWMALDASVSEKPGWQPPRSIVAAVRDYEVR